MRFNPKYIPYIIALIAIVVAGFFYQRNQALKLQGKIDTQNYLAQNDSISLEYNKKTNELEASKAAYVTKSGDLENYNKELANELKNTKGKVVTLNRMVFKLKQDTLDLRKALVENNKPEAPVQINDSTYQIPWDLTYSYDSANYDNYIGVTEIEIGVGNPYKVRHIFTELKSRESRINLVFGQKVENGQLRVFARSDYPGFSPTQLDGVLIDPNTNPYIKGLMKKRHWFTGFGVGPNMTMGYDFFNSRPALILGIGIQYNIYQW